MNDKRYTWPSPSDERVRELRQMSGDEYWHSPEWRMMRRYIIARDGHRCKLCNHDERLSVHHRTYERKRGQERPSDLITLCFRCHGTFHRHSRLAVKLTSKELRKRERRRREARRQHRMAQRRERAFLAEAKDVQITADLDREYAEIVRTN